MTTARAQQTVASVTENLPVARDTYRLRFRAPGIAATILPGQFVMVRLRGRTDPLLARPYALYDTVDDAAGAPTEIDIVYLVVGNGTQALRHAQPGDELDVWGPLGNTFPIDFPAGHLLLVAGGIGQTPFLAVMRELLGQRTYGVGRKPALPESVTLAYGARSAAFFAGLDDFRSLGPRVDLRLATEDGSAGHAGYVTALMDDWLRSTPSPARAVFACGPEPMLAAVAERAQGGGVPCWVSLETKMACGYGVCFSCVCLVLEGPPDSPAGGAAWDYRRVCLEGPVFPSDTIAWPELVHPG